MPPLDGRTLKPTHFERVALVYGLDLSKLLSTAEKLSLVKVSAARNDVAHGNLPFRGIFSRSGFRLQELRADIDNFEAFAFRLVETFDGYLNDRRYLTAV